VKYIILILLFVTLLNCTSNSQKKENKVPVIPKTETVNYTEFHPNGQLKIKGDLVKEIRQGKWISYYDNGKKWSEANYLEGKKNGQSKSFYTNGNLRFLGYYENDKKTDQWFFYNENGRFEKEVDFTKE
jgi:antitoxin component YwqK of YwqJK toxin-antitoxin module